MNDVFRPFLRRFLLVFFDDILVYSRNSEEHQHHLREVMKVLEKHKLYANQKKCSFGSSKTEYLGHIISEDGVAADGAKIQAMVEWPEPQNIKQLRGFLELTGYYHKFVKDYGLVARSLTTQLRNKQFCWGAKA